MRQRVQTVHRRDGRYASQRVQFGHPLADFEITQRKLAEAAADAYATDAMVGALSAQADRRETDWSVEAACAKVFASEALWRIADDMVQIAGGRGFRPAISVRAPSPQLA